MRCHCKQSLCNSPLIHRFLPGGTSFPHKSQVSFSWDLFMCLWSSFTILPQCGHGVSGSSDMWTSFIWLGMLDPEIHIFFYQNNFHIFFYQNNFKGVHWGIFFHYLRSLYNHNPRIYTIQIPTIFCIIKYYWRSSEFL